MNYLTKQIIQFRKSGNISNPIFLSAAINKKRFDLGLPLSFSYLSNNYSEGDDRTIDLRAPLVALGSLEVMFAFGIWWHCVKYRSLPWRELLCGPRPLDVSLQIQIQILKNKSS